MNVKMIDLFNKALKVEKPLDFKMVNEEAIKVGYFITPDCCSQEVLSWLKTKTFNPNSTFYKSWEDITSKTRAELALDQVLHYLSTYGAGFALGNGYVPNSDPVEIPYTQFKVIESATPEDILADCQKMLDSGIALKQETIDLFLQFFKDYKLESKVNLDTIKNKEAQAKISLEMKILPKDEFGMLRVIVASYSGTTELIKSDASINSLKSMASGWAGMNGWDLSKLDAKQLKSLSRIFNRYKPIFLALKGRDCNKSAINKIRKLSKKNHTPLKVGFWERCLSSGTIEEASAKVDSINSFKKAQLMQAILERLHRDPSMDGKLFVIRNGKMWVRDNYKPKNDPAYYAKLYSLLEGSIIDSLSKNSIVTETFVDENGKEFEIQRPKKVLIPSYLNVTLPTSEKNFLGNYPLGTSVQMSPENNIVGIYWRNEWGARDLDLHYTSDDGCSYGWCYGYGRGNGDIIFSGDMTNANPEATELFYLKKTGEDGILSVNNFSGGKCKLKFLVATEEAKENFNGDHYNNGAYMIDPNNIKFQSEMELDVCGEKKIASVNDGKILFMDFGAGNRRVTNSAHNKIIQDQMKVRAKSYIDLKPLLERAGFEIVESGECDLDFSNLAKSDLVKLLSD